MLALFRTEMVKQWRRPRTYVALGLLVVDTTDLHDRVEIESAVATTGDGGDAYWVPRDEVRPVPAASPRSSS